MSAVLMSSQVISMVQAITTGVSTVVSLTDLANKISDKYLKNVSERNNRIDVISQKTLKPKKSGKINVEYLNSLIYRFIESVADTLYENRQQIFKELFKLSIGILTKKLIK